MNDRVGTYVQPLVQRGAGRSPPAAPRTQTGVLTSGGPLRWDSIQRVLLCRPNHRLGNLLFLTPLLAEIEAHNPAATVDIVGASDGLRGLFAGFPTVGTVFELPRNALHAPGRFARVVHAFWRERYDLVIDPERRSRSARFIVNRCRATYRLGYTGAGNAGGLTHGVPGRDSPQHMSWRAVYLLRRASPAPDRAPGAPYPELDLRLSADERAWGAALVARMLRDNGAGPRAPAIAVFSNATGAKRYPSRWWRRLVARLRALLPDATFFEVLPPGSDRPSELGLPTYQSGDLRQVAAVVGASSLFISADCGVLHLACASGAPRVIGLFSVTDAAVYGPVGTGRRAIVTRHRTPEEVAEVVGETFSGVEEAFSVRRRRFDRPGLPRAT